MLHSLAPITMGNEASELYEWHPWTADRQIIDVFYRFLFAEIKCTSFRFSASGPLRTLINAIQKVGEEGEGPWLFKYSKAAFGNSADQKEKRAMILRSGPHGTSKEDKTCTRIFADVVTQIQLWLKMFGKILISNRHGNWQTTVWLKILPQLGVSWCLRKTIILTWSDEVWMDWLQLTYLQTTLLALIS